MATHPKKGLCLALNRLAASVRVGPDVVHDTEATMHAIVVKSTLHDFEKAGALLREQGQA